MLSLTKFLKMLPGVMPLKAGSAILDGELLEEAARKDIVLDRASLYGTVMVGPIAAEAIAAVYAKGALPMKKGQAIAVPESFIEAYVAGANATLERQRHRDECIADPTCVTEANLLDAFLVDSVFWRGGHQRMEMELAGVAVRKTVARYATNSGRNHGNEVTFHWVGSDGVARSSTKGEPSEKFNRRNDAERDWGL